MIMPEIRAILIADAQLMGVINAIVPKPTKRLDNVMMYEETPINNDGIVAGARIQLTTVCDTEEQYGVVYGRICKLLLIPDDRPLSATIRKVKINGGGSLYDAEREKYHKIIYLNITARS